MADLVGVELHELGHVFRLRNLLDRYPGRAGKGSAFPSRVVGERAADLVRGLPDPEYKRLVLLGGRVAHAFGLRGTSPELRSFDNSWVIPAPRHDPAGVMRGCLFAIFAHPSGVNRWWNEPENEAWARRFLVRAAEWSTRCPKGVRFRRWFPIWRVHRELHAMDRAIVTQAKQRDELDVRARPEDDALAALLDRRIVAANEARSMREGLGLQPWDPSLELHFRSPFDRAIIAPVLEASHGRVTPPRPRDYEE